MDEFWRFLNSRKMSNKTRTERTHSTYKLRSMSRYTVQYYCILDLTNAICFIRKVFRFYGKVGACFEYIFFFRYGQSEKENCGFSISQKCWQRGQSGGNCNQKSSSIPSKKVLFHDAPTVSRIKS